MQRHFDKKSLGRTRPVMNDSDRRNRRKPRRGEQAQIQPAPLPATRGRRPAPAPAPETAARLRSSGYDLSVLFSLLGNTLAGHDDANNMNFYHWAALRYFARVGDDRRPGPATSGGRTMTASGFARHIGGLHLTTASRTIRALTDRGLLSLVADPYDGRSLRGSFTIQVTREGLEMLRNDPNVYIGSIIEREMSPEKRAVLADAIETVMTATAELRLRISPSKK